MTIGLIEVLSGTSSIILIIISLYFGFKLISKYFQYKEKTLLFVGITGIFVFEPWWPSAISFLQALITGEGITIELYFLIGNVFIPIAILSWLNAFTNLLFEDKKRTILIATATVSCLFEAFFLYFLFTDVTIIGELQGLVDVQYKSFVLLYLFLAIVITLITGILFARESLKSDNPNTRAKGKLLVVAFVSYVVGAILDSAIPLNLITLPITRMIMVISSITFYGGFILPNWIKKFVLKDEKSQK